MVNSRDKRKGCWFGLNGRLAAKQPVRCAVELVLIDLAEIEDVAKAGGRGGGREGACRGELGGRQRLFWRIAHADGAVERSAEIEVGRSDARPEP